MSHSLDGKGPIITIPLVSGKVNGLLEFVNLEEAQAILGNHFDKRANFWIGAIKVRSAGLLEKIDRVVEFNVPEGWVVQRLAFAQVQKKLMLPIVANLELTPTPPNVSSKARRMFN